MSKNVIFLMLVPVLFTGCLLPYKTEFTCKNVIGGSCGNALDNHKESMEEAYTKKDDADLKIKGVIRR